MAQPLMGPQLLIACGVISNRRWKDSTMGMIKKWCAAAGVGFAVGSTRAWLVVKAITAALSIKQHKLWQK